MFETKEIEKEYFEFLICPEINLTKSINHALRIFNSYPKIFVELMMKKIPMRSSVTEIIEKSTYKHIVILITYTYSIDEEFFINFKIHLDLPHDEKIDEILKQYRIENNYYDFEEDNISTSSSLMVYYPFNFPFGILNEYGKNMEISSDILYSNKKQFKHIKNVYKILIKAYMELLKEKNLDNNG